jgi:hypothetical protein
MVLLMLAILFAPCAGLISKIAFRWVIRETMSVRKPLKRTSSCR